MANTLAEHIALEKENDHYISKHLPQRMGNSAPIAYGGYAISLAIHAACKSAPEGFHLFSAFGHFLRAVSTESKLMCKITALRKTRSFVTYRVEVIQNVRGSETPQLCMELLADFHKDEPSLLSYSTQPTRPYSHWKDCAPWDRILEEDWVKPGRISENQAKAFTTLFGLTKNLYEGRPCPEGVTSQNLMGLAKAATTSQDDLAPTAKTSADWIRVKHALGTEAEQMSSLGFIMDGVLSFLPLAHNRLFFDDVGACSSLDFALRIFSPKLRMDSWNLREVINHRAGHGRTYSESRLWDEDRNLVACMSQQSILRVPAKSARI
ncbi:thioesterase-like superfamily-domain-containing protein [Aspergillus leporis]|uniref:Thioesterase-like superfamily-domain-containing protein n=1 Tax=Aspergillus leporis TaxID=41062 RepID=A0A5N5WHW4_9EURO|nr:thioesterase-like superfamily-domain-containing protein [Aspergillus leporis]